MNFKDFLAFICIVFVFTMLGLACFYKTPNSDITNLVVGYVAGVGTTVITYYFGSSYKKPNEVTGTINQELPEPEDKGNG